MLGGSAACGTIANIFPPTLYTATLGPNGCVSTASGWAAHSLQTRFRVTVGACHYAPAVQIRPEEPQDEAAILELHRAAFSHQPDKVVQLVQDLRAATTDSTSLVAVDDGIVGHVLFTPSILDAELRQVAVQVLSPLGVLPERQGEGIGSALVRRGLELLAAGPVPVVFLEGSPDYYGRFGFKAAGELGFRRPSLRIPEPGFQAFLLPAYELWMTGTLVYSEPFWRNDAVGLRGERLAAWAGN
jgi:putative acetyltransferase